LRPADHATGKPSSPRKFRDRRPGPAIVFACLALLIILATGLAVWRRGAGPAIVMATTEDCRRSFDDAGCRAIVARAQSIHAATAPTFAQRSVCDFVYGAGACAPLKLEMIELTLFAPAIVAIATDLAARDILPLYLGPASAEGGDKAGGARRVYYRGAAVGWLGRQRVGGAEVPILTDLTGETLTVEAVRKLRSR